MSAGAGPRGPVVLIDDHDLLSTSLVLVLQRAGLDARRLPIRGCEEIVAEAGTTTGGVALVDLNLGEDPERRRMHGHQLISPLRQRGWRVLVMSGSGAPDAAAEAVAAGAEGFVDKGSSTEALIGAVRCLLAGGDVLGPAERQHLEHQARRVQMRRRQSAALLDRLTDRERQVLGRLADGSRAAAIADEFVVSLSTVRSQIRSILGKLGVGSQLEAVALLHAVEDD